MNLFAIVGEFWEEGAAHFLLVDVHLQPAQLLDGEGGVLQVGLVPRDADVDPRPVHDDARDREMPHLLPGAHHRHKVRALVVDGEAGIGCGSRMWRGIS